jgi:glycosyltransferase involved in cell wall biosynthesis
MQQVKVSVIICTHNPDRRIIREVLNALAVQTLERHHWELIIVDNNSDVSVQEVVNIDWHPLAHIIHEARPGLVFARIAGFKACTAGSLIVFIDDDNVADSLYLELALSFSELNRQVGCFGGRSIPEFETPPPDWLNMTGISLGCQEFGQEIYLSDYAAVDFRLSHYPEKAPIGTGMVMLYAAFGAYLKTVNPQKLNLGRKGNELDSGEDNDIVMSVIKNGYEIAYYPKLLILHKIPARRYSFNYLKEMAFKSNLSWMRVLTMHGVNPHSRIANWTVKWRQLKAWFVLSAWKSKLNYIKWRGACGAFEGLAE